MRFYNYLKTHLLIEGGNAIPTSVRINAQNVTATLQSVYNAIFPALRITKNDIRLLGSAGKKTSPSGDLDIAVSTQALILNNNLETFEDVCTFLEDKLKTISNKVIVMKGLGTVSVEWPIVNTDNLQNKSFCQVDFMLADSLDWMEFKNWSPKETESKYKGAHRNILMSALAKYPNYRELRKEGDTAVEWEKVVISIKGIVKNVESNLGKSGKIVKNKTVLNSTIITNDPQKAAELMLGPKAKVADFNSFESLYKIIMSNDFIWKQYRDDMLKDTAHDIHSCGLPLPTELEGYL